MARTSSSTPILRDGKVQPITDKDREEILAKNKEFADRALRVLAASYRDWEVEPVNYDAKYIEDNLTFIGLVGMIDPIRPEVKVAVEECKSAGIHVVMITGDHKDTAVAIAKDLGIIHSADEATTGSTLDGMSDEELDRMIEHYSVYARVQPEHKVRIVQAWKRKGRVTAMTGDGVNDAPSIKNADIGVGMQHPQGHPVPARLQHGGGHLDLRVLRDGIHDPASVASVVDQPDHRLLPRDRTGYGER